MRALVLFMFACVNLFGQQVADEFCYPTSPFRFDDQKPETEVDCHYLGQIKGGFYIDKQPFLAFNPETSTNRDYHLGNDLNGNGGQSTDLGDPVFVPAHGRVLLVRKTSTRDSWGSVVIIRHLLPTGQIVHSLYGHLQNIFVSEDQDVSLGTKLGTIGDANGFYSNQAHLHFEMFLEPKVSEQIEWSSISDVFRGYIESPSDTHLTGSFDPIFFIKTEREKESLGIQTGLFLTRSFLVKNGCQSNGSSDNLVINQFLDPGFRLGKDLFVIRKEDVYSYNVLPQKASNAVAMGLLYPDIWENRSINPGNPEWVLHNLHNPDDDIITGNYWVCPTEDVYVALNALNWQKFTNINRRALVGTFSDVSVRDLWGRKLDSASAGMYGDIDFSASPFKGSYRNPDDGLVRRFIDFSQSSPRDGYIAEPWLMPHVELTASDYPPGVCPAQPQVLLSSFGNKGGGPTIKYASECEPEPPTDPIITLGEPYCEGELTNCSG